MAKKSYGPHQPSGKIPAEINSESLTDLVNKKFPTPYPEQKQLAVPLTKNNFYIRIDSLRRNYVLQVGGTVRDLLSGIDCGKHQRGVNGIFIVDLSLGVGNTARFESRGPDHKNDAERKLVSFHFDSNSGLISSEAGFLYRYDFDSMIPTIVNDISLRLRRGETIDARQKNQIPLFTWVNRGFTF